MSNAQHTPGPWVVSAGMPVRIEANGVRIAKPLANMEMPVETYRANAQLIAAAPQLLAALERMQAMHDLMMKQVNHGASFYQTDCITEMNEAPIEARAAFYAA